MDPPPAGGAQVGVDLGEDVGTEAVDEGRSRASAEVAACGEFLHRKLSARGHGNGRRGDQGREQGREEGPGPAMAATA